MTPTYREQQDVVADILLKWEPKLSDGFLHYLVPQGDVEPGMAHEVVREQLRILAKEILEGVDTTNDRR